MKDRILKFLASEKISPAEFADKIGVQRSSMSHILNGRNHPSAAFLQKMLQVYPLLNPRWLMIGDGVMNSSSGDIIVPSDNTPLLPEPDSKAIPFTADQVKASENVIDHPVEKSEGEEMRSETTHDVNSPIRDRATIIVTDNQLNKPANDPPKITDTETKRLENLAPALNLLADTREIEQILFFYKDKTFVVYRPS